MRLHCRCPETTSNCTYSPAGEDLSISGVPPDQFTALSGTDVIASVSGVPEPSALSFLGFGMALLGLWKRRGLRVWFLRR